MIDINNCFVKHPHPFFDCQKWQQLVNTLAELYDAASGTVVQLREDEFNVVATSSNDDNFLAQNSNWPWEMRSFCRHMMETKQSLYVGDAANHAMWCQVQPVSEGPVRSYLGFPLFWPDGELFGSICVIDTKVTDYPPILVQLLSQFKTIIEGDLRQIVDYEKIKLLALEDELTGINNLRGFNVLAKQRLKDAHRFMQHVAIVYLDIDNLKQVNDEYGHQSGDHCIVALATLLKSASRDADIKARVGGDEFVVMLLSSSDAFISHWCKSIIEKYAGVLKDKPYTQLIGVSVGYSIYDPVDKVPLEDMVERSDNAMYANKQAKKRA
ncbi:sensor domain-containing diguanylate cyclase [Pseudoalteromonas sp. MMG005]|uniref:sensor domain-containing diguanylate cyclase n=1 Tax=Pseudoalteromonas sp. MMG005 TaxID=2822682 RepID=UPI001B39CE9F|nr:sensor domain-containing diguanylate cyclase [Pseudoalteromonas sp. MMG005]MBQ4844672.1 sensor domain-containing diguanylate cyclase [Pseudoalteromonas sp. MMG005]